MSPVSLLLAAGLGGSCPTHHASHSGWGHGASVAYAFAPDVTSTVRSAAGHAFATWNEANLANGSRVRFVPAGAGGLPALLVRVGRLEGAAFGLTHSSWRAQGELAAAEITLDLHRFAPQRSGSYFDGLYRAMLHEIGHTMGLDHPRGRPACEQIRKASVMNGQCGINDEEGHMAARPTACDNQMVGRLPQHRPPDRPVPASVEP